MSISGPASTLKDITNDDWLKSGSLAAVAQHARWCYIEAVNAGTTRNRTLLLIPSFFIIGLLTTTQLLDREIQERYILTVMALDDGSPALSATQVLTILVLDVNDETPIFLKQLYKTAVHENRDPGEFVVKVEAVDRDAGDFWPFTINLFVDHSRPIKSCCLLCLCVQPLVLSPR